MQHTVVFKITTKNNNDPFPHMPQQSPLLATDTTTNLYELLETATLQRGAALLDNTRLRLPHAQPRGLQNGLVDHLRGNRRKAREGGGGG